MPPLEKILSQLNCDFHHKNSADIDFTLGRDEAPAEYVHVIELKETIRKDVENRESLLPIGRLTP